MSLLPGTSAPAPRNVVDPPPLRPQLVHLVVGVLILSGVGWAIHDWWAARQASASPIACDFLNANDVSAAFGTPAGPGVRDTPDNDYEHTNSVCRFTLPARHMSVSLYVRWSGAMQELQSQERGLGDNRKTISGPGITGFTDSFLGGQFAFVVRKNHYFQVWTYPVGGNSASVENLALLAASRDHVLNG